MNSRSIEFWHFGVPTVTDMEATAERCEELGFDGLRSCQANANQSPECPEPRLSRRGPAPLGQGSGAALLENVAEVEVAEGIAHRRRL